MGRQGLSDRRATASDATKRALGNVDEAPTMDGFDERNVVFPGGGDWGSFGEKKKQNDGVFEMLSSPRLRARAMYGTVATE
jgi:hypothetical protein